MSEIMIHEGTRIAHDPVRFSHAKGSELPELPSFSGKNPEGWIFKAEKYFSPHHIGLHFLLLYPFPTPGEFQPSTPQLQYIIVCPCAVAWELKTKSGNQLTTVPSSSIESCCIRYVQYVMFPVVANFQIGFLRQEQQIIYVTPYQNFNSIERLILSWLNYSMVHKSPLTLLEPSCSLNFFS